VDDAIDHPANIDQTHGNEDKARSSQDEPIRLFFHVTQIPAMPARFWQVVVIRHNDSLFVSTNHVL
jgi:hypothetical protein